MSSPARLVVGYDASPDAVAALEWAVGEALRSRRPLTVLHAVDHLMDHPTLVPGPFPWPPVPARRSALSVAAEGAERARRCWLSWPGHAGPGHAGPGHAGPGHGRVDLTVTAETRVGDPATVLITASRSADLLVLGHRGAARARSRLPGYRTFTVADQAQCPVVVVRSEDAAAPGPGRPVVVGVDGGGGSDAAVRLGARIAVASGATLDLVAAYEAAPRSASYGPWALEGAGVPDFDTTGHHAGRTRIAAAECWLNRSHPGLLTRVDVREGEPLEVLVAASDGAGLLLVGMHREQSPDHRLPGRVDQGALILVHCPVAVVPAGDPARSITGVQDPEPAVQLAPS